MRRPGAKVVVKLQGGLGNQLFQYATARAVACRRRLPLWLDLSAFPADLTYKRTYLLHQYAITADGVIHPEADAPASAWARRLRAWRGRIAGDAAALHVAERAVHDDPALADREFAAGAPCYRFEPELLRTDTRAGLLLDGYWQSEDYFLDIADRIRRELRAGPELPPAKREARERIRDCNAVCVGVRRYEESPTAAVHWKLDGDFYERAMAHVAREVKDPVFFVFSTDLDWARSHLPTYPALEWIDPDAANEMAYADLALMSECRHFVLANSTYHWWGAWLGEDERSVVVAPARGWGNERAVPERWVRL